MSGEASVQRTKDFGRRTDAAGWQESFKAAMELAGSESGEDQAAAADSLNKHLHTENEKHVAIEAGVLPVLEKLLASTNDDASQMAKITLFGFGWRNGMDLAAVETSYKSTWLDAVRVEAAKEAWAQVDLKVGWDEGKRLMEEEVASRGGDGRIGALTWGETSFTSLAIMLGHVNPKPGEHFLDLGAGLGKVLCGAHLLCDFASCVGIELIAGTAATGQELVNEFSEKNRIHEGTLELRQGDFLEHDWSHADVVFANASMFPKDLLKAIAKKMDRELKEGARVVFITNSLKGRRLKQLNARRLYCKHQEEGDTPATFFLYQMTAMVDEDAAHAEEVEEK